MKVYSHLIRHPNLQNNHFPDMYHNSTCNNYFCTWIECLLPSCTLYFIIPDKMEKRKRNLYWSWLLTEDRSTEFCICAQYSLRLLSFIRKYLCPSTLSIFVKNMMMFLKCRAQKTLHPTSFSKNDVVDVHKFVCFHLGNSSASEFYMPTFRNTLSFPSS